MTETSLFEKSALLGKAPLFADLDQPTLSRLADLAHFRDYTASQFIFHTGAQGDSMLVIAHGAVRITAMAPTARDVILTDLKPGDSFGEIALLDGGGRSADAHALTNCKLLILERVALLQVVRTEPDFTVRLLELLCARLRRSDERMMDIAFLQLPRRLARVLLTLSSGRAAENNRPSGRLAHSQSELADMVGGSRENVNRCLRKWQKDALIDLTDGWISLRDRPALEKIADAD